MSKFKQAETVVVVGRESPRRGMVGQIIRIVATAIRVVFSDNVAMWYGENEIKKADIKENK